MGKGLMFYTSRHERFETLRSSLGVHTGESSVNLLSSDWVLAMRMGQRCNSSYQPVLVRGTTQGGRSDSS